MRPVPCPVSPEILRNLYSVSKLTDQEIADHIGQGATVKRVRSWRHRFGIPTINRSERHDVPPIEGRLRSLLVGSMLGDGGISRNPHTALFSENHAANQLPYLEWKCSQWGEWVKSGIKPRTWKNFGKVYPGFGFRTVAHASLVPWYDQFYPVGGSKRLPESVVSLVDSFAFAIWYMDDGGPNWWPRITFGLDFQSRGVALGVLEKFGLSPIWQLRRGKTGDFIFEGETQAERFIEVVRPHVPPCMEHKLQFGFQGRYYDIRHSSPESTLRDMASRGVPIRRMARDLGLSASVVSRRLQKLGIEHPRTVGRPPSRRQ